MIDLYQVEQWREIICDRLTAEELVDLLGLTTEQVFDRFTDECLEISVEDI